ncbi:hypothetical protein ACGFK1_30300 [Mycobacterium sp. NPDC048908]|uniref:hypothetical protein n=1 Tax=Mycobacterium sp. NPDC048908 TaxID=3364292 RepID=UPI00371276A2
MRFISSVCVFAACLVIIAANAGIGYADTGETAGAEPETAAAPGKSDRNDSDSKANGASNPDPPSSTIGNGREEVGVETRAGEKKNNDTKPATKKYTGSFVIPYFRIPRQKELPPKGLPDPSLFYGTIVIPVPTLGDFLAAMQPQPPAPAPAPSFKMRGEEAPPVVDSSGGGGVDPLAVGVAAEPPVLQAPLVIAPLPVPLPPAPPPFAPVGAGANAPPASVAPAEVPVPVLRGSPPPAPEPVASPVTPMSAAPTRLGYQRELRGSRQAELTMLALPGVAGLLLLTMSGGVIGYRQANSARMLCTQRAARFLR